MDIIGKRKIFFFFSGTLVLLSIIAFFVWGLKLGIDFTGGSMMELYYPQKRPSVEQVRNELKGLNLGEIKIQPVGKKEMILKFKSVDEKTHHLMLEKLGAIKTYKAEVKNGKMIIKPNEQKVKAVELHFESVGPVIGQELKTKTEWAIALAIIAIILYIAWSFRKVSRPVASWKYGVIAIVALFHDIMITVGFFVVLGKFYGVEVNAPFVAALLTILGYSVNDTIVIFDRIRENLKYSTKNFAELVNKSVNQNILRSIYTSFTTLLALFALYFFGGATIKNFVLALIIGITFGTYSSIFLASPLLVVWEKWQRRHAS